MSSDMSSECKETALPSSQWPLPVSLPSLAATNNLQGKVEVGPHLLPDLIAGVMELSLQSSHLCLICHL